MACSKQHRPGLWRGPPSPHSVLISWLWPPSTRTPPRSVLPPKPRVSGRQPHTRSWPSWPSSCFPGGGAVQAPGQCCSVLGSIARVRIALPSSKRIGRHPHGGLTGLRGSLGGSTEGLLWLMRKGAATLEDDKQPLMRESRWQTEGHNLTCRKRFLFSRCAAGVK